MSQVHIIAEKATYPGNLADELFDIERKMAALKKTREKVRAQAVATGEDVLEGTFARLTISHVDGSHAINYREAAEDLLNPDQLDRYTVYRHGYTRYLVKSRHGNERKRA